jgi:hypothetical protein
MPYDTFNDVMIANAARVDLPVPVEIPLRSIAVRVLVQPSSAAVLIYGGPDYDRPVRFNGPQSEGEIATDGRRIYIQSVDGAVGAQVYTLGWYAKDGT